VNARYNCSTRSTLAISCVSVRRESDQRLSARVTNSGADALEDGHIAERSHFYDNQRRAHRHPVRRDGGNVHAHVHGKERRVAKRDADVHAERDQEQPVDHLWRASERELRDPEPYARRNGEVLSSIGSDLWGGFAQLWAGDLAAAMESLDRARAQSENRVAGVPTSSHRLRVQKPGEVCTSARTCQCPAVRSASSASSRAAVAGRSSPATSTSPAGSSHSLALKPPR